MADAVGTLRALQAGEVVHREQVTLAIAHHQSREIVWPTSIPPVKLHNDASDLSPLEGVVDVAAANCCADIPKRGPHIQVQSSHLVTVQRQLPAGCAGIEARADSLEATACLGHADEPSSQSLELRQAEPSAAAVHQFQL